MAFEKAKVLRAAEKFLSQGKINAAIKEYRQIVDNDEDDFTTLNMLGDLYARAGQKEAAISCFRRIAEHYREQEFTLKAIAMYKKIERLKPRDPEIADKLAKLYVAQGLVVDARAQYLIVADAYARSGETKQTLNVLHKIADLDPHNTEIRLKLAAGYLKEGLGSEAANAFVEAGSRLYEEGVFEKSLESFTKALELQPHDIMALKGLIAAHVAIGTADEAAELLEKAVKDRPDDNELLSLLAQTYIEAEDPKGAERITSSLVEKDPSKYARFIEVARLYLKSGGTHEASRILAGITEQMLAGREENDLLQLVNDVLDRDPEDVQALRLLVRIHWWQRDTEKLRVALERLAESAEAAGLAEDERYALTQLVRLAPDEKRYFERLTELGGVQEDIAQEDIAEEPFAQPETPAAEVPSFERFAIVDEAQPEQPSASESVAAGKFEFNSVAEPTEADANASFADLNESFEQWQSADADALQPGVQEFDLRNDIIERASAAPTESPQPEGDSSRRESLIRRELESVDFYITQGYTDIALDTLDMLERQFGSDPQIDARRSQIAAGTKKGSDAAEVFEFGGVEQVAGLEDQQPGATDTAVSFTISDESSSTTPANIAEPTPRKGIDSGLAEIFEEFREAAEEEQDSSTEDYETHYNMGIAYKEMDLLDEAIQEFQTAAGLAGPDDGTSRYLQCCNMLGHCFIQKGIPRAAIIWFKKGLEAPGHSEDEYLALRYELGSAYEQMGDYHRAFNIFTEVYGVDVSYRDVAEKLKALKKG